MTVWTYHEVKKLNKKRLNDEEITVPEIRKLEKYIRRKKKVSPLAKGKWSNKQLLKAERLLHSLKQDKDMVVEVQAHE